MAKVTLTFNLPEEKSEYRITSKAEDMYSIIYDLANRLREWTKYREYKTEAESTLMEEVHTFFWDTCSKHGVDPYEE